jgi:hypothetical protein
MRRPYYYDPILSHRTDHEKIAKYISSNPLMGG